MSLGNLLLKIDSLQHQIDANGNLDEAVKKRIQYKFRLDWNYYSNAMEGNSLTKQETRSVMMNLITINGKPYRDVKEVEGHDKAVLEIFEVGKGNSRLSETRIKEMHKMIVVEEDPEKAHQVGEWKTGANFMQNYRGERFDFLAPELVADAMHELLNKTNAQIDAFYHAKKESWHPAVIAFYFHLEYVKIHPFYDGNGRTARLLMNLLLISFGFPPVILNLENKERYYSLLTDIQGYGGNPDLFYEFMGELLIRSQEMVLDAIDGKDISEEDDLDKEIALFKKQLETNTQVISKSGNTVLDKYTESIKPLFTYYLEKVAQFDELFSKKSVYNKIDNEALLSEGTDNFDSYFIDLNDELAQGRNKMSPPNILELSVDFFGFKNDGLNTFNVNSKVFVHFDEFKYSISHNGRNYQNENFLNKLYSENIDESEIKSIVKSLVSWLLIDLKRFYKKEE